MQEPLLKSLIFHLVVAIMLVASSWSIFKRQEKIPEIKPIVVQLAPMGDVTNLKPAPKQEVAPKPKAEQKKPEPKKPEPKKPEPKKPEPKKPEPKKEPKKPEPKKPEKEKDELAEMLKNLDKPEKEEPKPDTSELNDLLKDLDAKKPEAKTSDAANTNPDSKSDLPFDPNSPETLAIVDYINKLIIDQIKLCWSPPAGGRDAQDIIVRVNVDIALDGTIKFAGFGSSGSGAIYQAAADSARRAVLDPMCNPLKTLPPADKYHIWKEMTLIFNPRDLIY